MSKGPEQCTPPENPKDISRMVDFRICQLVNDPGLQTVVFHTASGRRSWQPVTEENGIPSLGEVSTKLNEVVWIKVLDSVSAIYIGQGTERWVLAHACDCKQGNGELTIRRMVNVGDGKWDIYEYMFMPKELFTDNYVFQVDYKRFGEMENPLNRRWRYVAPRPDEAVVE